MPVYSKGSGHQPDINIETLKLLEEQRAERLADTPEGAGRGLVQAAHVLNEEPLLATSQSALPTPWLTLTAAITGFYPGRLYHVFGEEGVGKTTFAANLMHFLLGDLLEPECVIYLAVEPSREEVAARLVTLRLGDNAVRWRHLLYLNEELATDREIEEVAANVQIDLQDRGYILPATTMLECGNPEGALRGGLEEIVQRGGHPRVLIVDTWTGWVEGRKGPATENATHAARGLSDLAQEYGLSIITLGHTRKSAPGEKSHTPYKCPTRDAERGVKALRMRAAVVIALWRETPQLAPHTFLYLHKNHTPGPSDVLYISLAYSPCELLVDDPSCIPTEAKSNYGLGEPLYTIYQTLYQHVRDDEEEFVQVYPRRVARQSKLRGQRYGGQVREALETLGVALGQQSRDENGRFYYLRREELLTRLLATGLVTHA